ncbi:MAG: hypothetical protein JKY71_04745 [Alphaproteobacteria bacterium]|nr:hypothetical protein [Alphaproteobacteria bacterium]
MTDQSVDNANTIVLAGAFAFEAIRNYVNEIRAASYPQTPQQTGGEPYVFFNEVLDKVDAIANGQESLASSEKAQIRQLSLNAVREFVETCEADGLRDDHAYERFKAKQGVIERLLAGETPREVLAALKADDVDPGDGAPGSAP